MFTIYPGSHEEAEMKDNLYLKAGEKLKKKQKILSSVTGLELGKY